MVKLMAVEMLPFSCIVTLILSENGVASKVMDCKIFSVSSGSADVISTFGVVSLLLQKPGGRSVKCWPFHRSG